MWQVCHTTYKEECKPTYNYQQSCKSIPEQKCGYKKKCSTRWIIFCIKHLARIWLGAGGGKMIIQFGGLGKHWGTSFLLDSLIGNVSCLVRGKTKSYVLSSTSSLYCSFQLQGKLQRYPQAGMSYYLRQKMQGYSSWGKDRELSPSQPTNICGCRNATQPILSSVSLFQNNFVRWGSVG